MMLKFKNLEETIKYKFNSKNLLKRCLTHKSYDKNTNNEKLEFLGDRVLGLVISKNLLTKYPNEKEGVIDKKYANLVNKKKCAEIVQPEIDPRHGGTHSAYRKLAWDMKEHTLPTKNRPRTSWNTRGGTNSANQKLARDKQNTLF